MRLNNSIFLILFLTFAGCAAAPPASDPPKALLGEKPDLPAMRSFQKLAALPAGTKEYEKARVDYLLERIGKSPYTFVRNQMEYSNMRAVSHLKWKYLRFQEEAPTAEAFVDRIAVGSRMSGREYQMRNTYGKYYSLKNILHQELDYLDGGLKEYYDELAQEKAQAAEIEKEIAAVKEQEALAENNGNL